MTPECFNLVLDSEIVLPPGISTWGPVIGFVRYADKDAFMHNLGLFPKVEHIVDPSDSFRVSNNESLFRLVNATIGNRRVSRKDNGMFDVYDAGIIARTINNQLRIVSELPFGFEIPRVYSQSRDYSHDLYQARVRTALASSQLFKLPVTIRKPKSEFITFSVSYSATPPEFSNDEKLIHLTEIKYLSSHFSK